MRTLDALLAYKFLIQLLLQLFTPIYMTKYVGKLFFNNKFVDTLQTSSMRVEALEKYIICFK